MSGSRWIALKALRKSSLSKNLVNVPTVAVKPLAGSIWEATSVPALTSTPTAARWPRASSPTASHSNFPTKRGRVSPTAIGRTPPLGLGGAWGRKSREVRRAARGCFVQSSRSPSQRWQRECRASLERGAGGSGSAEPRPVLAKGYRAPHQASAAAAASGLDRLGAVAGSTATRTALGSMSNTCQAQTELRATASAAARAKHCAHTGAALGDGAAARSQSVNKTWQGRAVGLQASSPAARTQRAPQRSDRRSGAASPRATPKHCSDVACSRSEQGKTPAPHRRERKASCEEWAVFEKRAEGAVFGRKRWEVSLGCRPHPHGHSNTAELLVQSGAVAAPVASNLPVFAPAGVGSAATPVAWWNLPVYTTVGAGSAATPMAWNLPVATPVGAGSAATPVELASQCLPGLEPAVQQRQRRRGRAPKNSVDQGRGSGGGSRLEAATRTPREPPEGHGSCQSIQHARARC